MATTKPELTPISAWTEEYEVVTLSSGKVVGLRQVDVLSILTVDGRIPNVLLPAIQESMGTQHSPSTGQVEVALDDLLEINHLLDKLTRSCFVHPKIVDSREALERGEGILIDMVPYQDKMFLIAWCLGGQAAIDASQTFLEKQATGVVGVQPSNGVSSESEPDSEHS